MSGSSTSLQQTFAFRCQFTDQMKLKCDWLQRQLNYHPSEWPYMHTSFPFPWSVVMRLTNQLTQSSGLSKNHHVWHLPLIAMTWTIISYQPSASHQLCVSPFWPINWPLSANWHNFILFFMAVLHLLCWHLVLFSLSTVVSYLALAKWFS